MAFRLFRSSNLTQPRVL